jgi:SAM-dependent methyltransferase
MTDRTPLLAGLSDLRTRGEAASRQLDDLVGAQVAVYRGEVNAAVRNGIESLRSIVSKASGGHPFCEELMDRTGEYLDWLQWTLWDLPAFAAAIQPDPAAFRPALTGCALIYFAGRILDDFLDRHYLYRGRRETLLASLPETAGPHADAIVVIVAWLVFTEGVSQLSVTSGANPAFGSVLDSVRRAFTGVLLEYSNSKTWDESFYTRLIGLKNVDYFRILYAAVDPERRSPLYPFLCDYYALAQELNDVQDFARDAGQGTPNLIAIAGSRDAAELRVGGHLLRLAQQAGTLPEVEQLTALAKLAESCEEARRAGLFARESSAPHVVEASWPSISWQSEIHDFLAIAGADALETSGCPVCGTSSSALLFRKQGFAYQRCVECDHVYVGQRLRSEISKSVRRELAAIPVGYWPGENLFAADWARLLEQHAPGRRLLDVRFQAGVFPRVCRAAGFHVYGCGPEPNLRRLFGERLAGTDLEAGTAPWGSFDAITLLHSIDRFPDPLRILQALRPALNPNGVILIVTPDIESVHFRIFGKRWDALSPVARDHVYGERSLFRLLRSAGFEPLARLPQPSVPHEVRTRWMRMFRSMEGDETGDLAVLARPIETAAPTIPDADIRD